MAETLLYVDLILNIGRNDDDTDGNDGNTDNKIDIRNEDIGTNAVIEPMNDNNVLCSAPKKNPGPNNKEVSPAKRRKFNDEQDILLLPNNNEYDCKGLNEYDIYGERNKDVIVKKKKKKPTDHYHKNTNYTENNSECDYHDLMGNNINNDTPLLLNDSDNKNKYFLPPGWICKRTLDGDEYYYNIHTGAKTFEFPSHYDKKVPGLEPLCHNTNTSNRNWVWRYKTDATAIKKSKYHPSDPNKNEATHLQSHSSTNSTSYHGYVTPDVNQFEINQDNPSKVKNNSNNNGSLITDSNASPSTIRNRKNRNKNKHQQPKSNEFVPDNIPLPKGWQKGISKDGLPYYFKGTKISFKHPLDKIFKNNSNNSNKSRHKKKRKSRPLLSSVVQCFSLNKIQNHPNEIKKTIYKNTKIKSNMDFTNFK